MKRFIVLASALVLLLAAAVPAGAANQSVEVNGEISAELEAALADSADAEVNVLISTNGGSYADLVAAIEAAGGTVTQQYKYVDGIAATLPAAAVFDLRTHADVSRIGKDVLRSPAAEESISRDDAAGLDGAMAATALDTGRYEFTAVDVDAVAADPTLYLGYQTQNALDVWAQGNFGQGSLISVIDTGVYADHVLFSDGAGGSRVVGGVDLSTDAGTAFEGFDRVDNHWHGTHVAGIAAGFGGIVAPNADPLVESIEYNSGAALPAFDASNKLITLAGMAPLANLYGVKVFDHTGGSASESIIIAAIEHSIDLKVQYDATGGADGLDIDVINMSLGGWNGYDGRDMEDTVVDYATSVGIAVVASASNDGPYSGSIQSPGTANSSVTVGAIAEPVTTRVFWDMNYSFAPIIGLGELLYVTDDPQVIYFSSRGPTADGRDKPTVSGIGVFVLSAWTGSSGALGWASGTSMSAPNVAGVTALLNTYGESLGASPYDYKQALVAGSTPVPGFDEYDQGAGLIDAGDAMAALQADGNLGEAHPDLSNGHSSNIARPKGTQLGNVHNSNGITMDITLAPGMQEHFYFDLHPNAERVTIDITNVDLGVDLGLNSFEMYVQGGMSGVNSAYVDTTNVWGDASIAIEDLSTSVTGTVFGVFTQDQPLMPGYWKLVIENDWTSYDTISGTFTIHVETGNSSDQPDESYDGTIDHHEAIGFFPVGFGANGVELELSWRGDHGSYSTSDLDLIVAWFDTAGNLHFDFGAATLNAPEMVVIDSTDIDAVFVLIDGFNTYGQTERWDLEVRYR